MGEPSWDDELRALVGQMAEITPMPIDARHRVRERLHAMRDLQPDKGGVTDDGGRVNTDGSVVRAIPTTRAVGLTVAGTLGGLVVGLVIG